jgi:NADPH-dependent 2,4-dienoyl-CoA reductase/sulfur reductase-like enzyme
LIKDVTIIGGGPSGLFAAFYAGLRGVSCRVVDALPQLGGQLMALYPEKYIYDVGGIPKILAKDLANAMIEQGMQFDPEVVLEAEVQELVREDGHLRLVTARGDYLTRTVIITGGKGALNPRVLECPGWDDLYGSGDGLAHPRPAAGGLPREAGADRGRRRFGGRLGARAAGYRERDHADPPSRPVPGAQGECGPDARAAAGGEALHPHAV